jgi:dsDNA-specific endonuclease/ATPase MutS2
LSEGEILNNQLNRFYSALDKAIQGNIKEIVFIHGLGNGKLKYEIRKAIDTKYPDLTYQDASFKEYGFGATLVRLA